MRNNGEDNQVISERKLLSIGICACGNHFDGNGLRLPPSDHPGN